MIASSRTKVLGLTVLLFSFGLVGCPYQSQVPLDQASLPIDTRLLGVWREDSSTAFMVYTIEPQGDFEYAVRSEGDSGMNQYQAYLTQLGSHWFLNLKNSDENSTERYSLFRLEIGDDGASVTLFPVTENILEKFTRSSDLREFFEKYQDLSFFYEKPTRYVHPQSVPEQNLDQTTS